jgi:hypothetical protein
MEQAVQQRERAGRVRYSVAGHERAALDEQHHDEASDDFRLVTCPVVLVSGVSRVRDTAGAREVMSIEAKGSIQAPSCLPSPRAKQRLLAQGPDDRYSLKHW